MSFYNVENKIASAAAGGGNQFQLFFHIIITLSVIPALITNVSAK